MDGYGHIFTFKNKNTVDIWLNESSVLCSRNFRSLQMSSRGLMIHLSSNCRTTALKTKNDIYVSTKLIPRIYSEALPEASLFCVALKKKKEREKSAPACQRSDFRLRLHVGKKAEAQLQGCTRPLRIQNNSYLCTLEISLIGRPIRKWRFSDYFVWEVKLASVIRLWTSPMLTK